MNVKTISILLISASLAGCSWFNSLSIEKTPTEKTPLKLSKVEPLSPKPITWFIITPENMQEVLADLKEKGYDPVLYGLTDEGYKNLSVNMAEIRKYIILQQKSLDSYKEYYEPTE